MKRQLDLKNQQYEQMGHDLEQMRQALDVSRAKNRKLLGKRPTLKFIGFQNDEPWEMISLRERLKTVEMAMKIYSKELAESILSQ